MLVVSATFHKPTYVALIFLTTEWHSPRETLADDAAQRPPIDRVRVVVPLDDLWGKILLCSNKRVCSVPGELAVTVRAKAFTGMHGRNSFALDVVCGELDRNRIAAEAKRLGQSKVGQNSMSMPVEQNVLRLEITD